MAEFQALIIYGTGMQAKYFEEKNVTLNKDGEQVKPILVAPSIELMSRYNLDESDLPIKTEDGSKAMWVEYPIDEIDWLNKSKRGAVLFIWCAFNGSKTPIMEKMRGLFEKIKENDRERMMLRARIFSLQSELEYVTNVQIELAKQKREFTDTLGKKDVYETGAETYEGGG